MNFRKKPVVIEAFQMTEGRRGDNIDWPNWLNVAWNKNHDEPGAVFPKNYPDSDGTDELCIFTLEGVHLVQFGDWIIRGVKGELYPCKPDIFEATYEPECSMPFGLAIEALKSGKKVARSGWNGKGMFVYYVPANQYKASTKAARDYFGADKTGIHHDAVSVPYNAYLAIKNVNDTVSTWVPSINDCLAEDWYIVP